MSATVDSAYMSASSTTNVIVGAERPAVVVAADTPKPTVSDPVTMADVFKSDKFAPLFIEHVVGAVIGTSVVGGIDFPRWQAIPGHNTIAKAKYIYDQWQNNLPSAEEIEAKRAMSDIKAMFVAISGLLEPENTEDGDDDVDMFDRVYLAKGMYEAQIAELEVTLKTLKDAADKRRTA